jgi:hypothetical protein
MTQRHGESLEASGNISSQASSRAMPILSGTRPMSHRAAGGQLKPAVPHLVAHSAVFDVFYAGEKMHDLRSAKNDWQLLRLFGSGDDRFQVPPFLEGDTVHGVDPKFFV